MPFHRRKSLPIFGRPDVPDEKVCVPPAFHAPERPKGGFVSQAVGLVHYLMQTEVHTYAFSVAANAILSLFPFIVMLYTISRRIFHSHAMDAAIGDIIHFFLPTGQQFVARNMEMVAARHDVQIISLVMLFISCTGVFLPLEVALNQVWGVTKHRSYLMNQLVALGLALIMGLVALGSVLLNAGQRKILTFLFFNHTDNIVFHFLAYSLIAISTVAASVVFFFLIYWLLPNRRLPALAVIPTAIITGLLWELAKVVYVAVLPFLDLQAVYGPFYVSVGLIIWAYVSGLIMLGGAHYSATRHTLRVAWQAELEERKKEQEELSHMA